ncbi:MAG: hypothetical protein ABJP45_04180 [Cyclobacteriaceae bacterium]
MFRKLFISAVLSALTIQIYAQQDTLVITHQNNVLDGERITDYTNKWKVTFVDSEGKETPNKIWTDYGQIISLDGKKYFHRVQDLYDPQMNLQDTWINMVEHKTLVPVSFSTLNPKGGFAHYQFDGAKITGNTNQATAGELTEIDLSFDEAVFDWNLYGMLLVGLPFKTGLIAKLPFYAPQQGGLGWIAASVVGKESMKMPDGKSIQTWKVQTNQRLTFWVSEQAPYVIRLELELQNNARLVWETIK